MSKLHSKSRRHRHNSNPNELHIEVSRSFKRWLVILMSALTVGTLVYFLATARENWISMGIDRYVLPFMIWGLVLSPILAFLFLRQSGRTLSHVKFLRVFGVAFCLLPLALLFYVLPATLGMVNDHLTQYKQNPVLSTTKVGDYNSYEITFVDMYDIITIKTPTTTKSTRKKLNIQHDLAPGENVYVTYKRIYIKNSLVTENRYADIVIHAPKES
ncbi:chloride channel protein [Paenibacillus sp. 1781tsa1]|uniref:chloride channel protein n=1 Tax=Paenibacillus sp. 1781tsa1 TaxID=2953810 RepID=UPI00209F89EC|nr:chloride channel protein [Paenibacillus sp. 1781tsa1]MCP1184780.1 chloride channel protein [Paenibacillus sp. 1781tsa1]